MPSRKWLPSLLFLIFAAAFPIVNRGAYKSYFQDDEIDNLSLTRSLGLFNDFIKPMLIPRFEASNFRPVGHLYFRLMGNSAGFNYPPYILSIHALHLVNVALLWLVLRRLGFPPLAAGAGTLFWAFHMAMFDVYWKPMYVFDLLCASFCLLALLAYMKDRWLLALLSMWIAYRAKEVAIMLPAVLAGYEWLLGQKRFTRLLPFFALSLTIGAQAIAVNAMKPENAYTLHSAPLPIWQCIRFYAGQVFLVPYAGLAVFLIPLLARDRKTLFGFAAFAALLTPMLLLPGRLFGAYLYVPLLGLAASVAGLAATVPLPLIALFFLIWLPWNFVNMRWDRRATLAVVNDRRTFIQELRASQAANPDIRTYIYGESPYTGYATRAAIQLLHPPNVNVQTAVLDSPEARHILQPGPAIVLNWNAHAHHLHTLTKRPGTPLSNYIKMDLDTPIWQLQDGWYQAEVGNYRWTKPHATAKLFRPESARAFALTVNMGPEYLAEVPRNHVEVSVNDKPIGSAEFDHPGWQTVRWDLQGHEPAGPVTIEIHVSPELRKNRIFGIAVVGFGFVE